MNLTAVVIRMAHSRIYVSQETIDADVADFRWYIVCIVLALVSVERTETDTTVGQK